MANEMKEAIKRKMASLKSTHDGDAVSEESRVAGADLAPDNKSDAMTAMSEQKHEDAGEDEADKDADVAPEVKDAKEPTGAIKGDHGNLGELVKAFHKPVGRHAMSLDERAHVGMMKKHNELKGKG